MRSIALAAALALCGPSFADLPPRPPESPLGEACQPFLGVWHRVEPQQTRGGKTWWVVVVDSDNATVVNYGNQEDINIQAEGLPFALTCAKNADGTVTLDFAGDREMKLALTVKSIDESTFTTTEESTYLLPGPPDPNWKPETLTITWKRLFR